MAVQHRIWKIGEKPQLLRAVRLDSEALLEEQITGNMSIACCIWMLIGRQVYIYFGKCIDLLATDDASIILIFELKCIGTNVWAGVIRCLRSSPLRGSLAAVLTRGARWSNLRFVFLALRQGAQQVLVVRDGGSDSSLRSSPLRGSLAAVLTRCAR